MLPQLIIATAVYFVYDKFITTKKEKENAGNDGTDREANRSESEPPRRAKKKHAPSVSKRIAGEGETGSSGDEPEKEGSKE